MVKLTIRRKENGDLHCIDGPAIILPPVDSCSRSCSWYVDDEKVNTNEEFQKLSNMSDEDMTIMILTHGDVQ